MPVWFVSSTNPGLDAFLRLGCVAVNFWVREPTADLTAADIRHVVGADEGPELAPGVRTRFANQLAAFAEVATGDRVVTFDGRRRETLHVGTVLDAVRYEDPPSIARHPHVIPVRWDGTVQRADLADGGDAIPRTPGTTVARIYETIGVTPDPVANPPHRASRPPSTTASRSRDRFTWEPADGPHRYRLVQTFGRPGNPDHPFVVFMVNPGGNDIDRIRRSTTCHRVRAWGLAHGFDGASYLNLFSIVTNDVRALATVHPEQLNGPLADDVIAEVVDQIGGVVVAGWGNPSVDRFIFDSRVTQVRSLVGDRLKCLGVTDRGYPKHGRRWNPDDELMDLGRDGTDE